MEKKDFFEEVFDVLVNIGGAHSDTLNRLQFVTGLCRERPVSEYRFMGHFGFGGKFRYPEFKADYYPEDKSSDRDARLAELNSALKALKSRFDALSPTWAATS